MSKFSNPPKPKPKVEADPWRPIDSIPEQMSGRVLVWGPHMDEAQMWQVAPGFMSPKLQCGATHWMPVPKPPERK
jgi:hypothetical protein